MERNKIIAVAVLAIGVVAWRMGAMQEQGASSAASAGSAGSAGGAAAAQAEGMFTLTTNGGGTFQIPLEQARLFGMIENALEWKQVTEMGCPIQSSVLQILLEDLDWVLQVRSQKRANETEQQAAERIVRAMPVGPFNQDRLIENIAKLQASDYLVQPALVERYARDIANMLLSQESMRLLANGDSTYAKNIKDMNVALPDYAKQRIINYMPSLGWIELFTLRGRDNGEDLMSAEFSPDGSKVVTAHDVRSVKIRNADTGVLEHVLRGHSDIVSSAVFSPDGSRVVTASWDKTARLWNANTGMPEHVLKGHTGEVLSAKFSTDGSKVVTASRDKTARIWNADTGASEHELQGHAGEVVSAEFSTNGSKVVTASRDTMARIWNADTGVLEHVLRGHTEDVLTAEFSTNGSKVVTASRDTTARIWNADTGAPEHVLQGHTGGVVSAKFSTDGSKVVTASHDGTAIIWNANTGAQEHVLRGHTEDVLTAEFSPDGSKVVTASADSTVRVWNASTGVQEQIILQDEDGWPWLHSAKFSPDGNKIMAASEDEKIRIFLYLPTSLPGVSDLDVTIFIRLLYWAHQKKQKVLDAGWVKDVSDAIGWEDIKPSGMELLLKKWTQKVMNKVPASQAASGRSSEAGPASESILGKRSRNDDAEPAESEDPRSKDPAWKGKGRADTP